MGHTGKDCLLAQVWNLQKAWTHAPTYHTALASCAGFHARMLLAGHACAHDVCMYVGLTCVSGYFDAQSAVLARS